MLDSHNFMIEHPDAEVDFIEEMTQLTPFAAERVKNWKLPPEPAPKKHCATCGQVTT